MADRNRNIHSTLPKGVTSHFVMAGDIRTHYLEAGAEHQDSDVVILIHSAEYGGRAEYSWFANIAEFAKHFHVYAPDMVGFGKSDKIHSFDDQWTLRINHIKRFMETICIPAAHFVGSSYAGGLIQRAAVMRPSPWNILSIMTISGGGAMGGGPSVEAARHILIDYDGTKEWYKRLLQMLIYDPKWSSDEIVEERWRASIEPGAWEALSAARFTRPGAERSAPPPPLDASTIKVPTLIVCGDLDEFRPLSVFQELHKQIHNSELKVFSPCKHMAHYEYTEEFNRLAIDFLKRHSTKKQPQAVKV